MLRAPLKTLGIVKILCCPWRGNFWKALGERGEWASARVCSAFARLLPAPLGYWSFPRRSEHQEPMKIIREILHPHLETSSPQPDGANQLAAHRGDLMAEAMFDARSNARAAPVVRFLLGSQRVMARPFSVNLRSQLPGLQLNFDFLGPIGRVGPHIPPGLRKQQHVLQDLPVMHGRIGHRIVPNQFVRLIHIHMVLVAIVIVAMLHGPASVRVFLPSLRRRPLPFRRALPGFVRRVFVAGVALFRHGDE